MLFLYEQVYERDAFCHISFVVSFSPSQFFFLIVETCDCSGFLYIYNCRIIIMFSFLLVIVTIREVD